MSNCTYAVYFKADFNKQAAPETQKHTEGVFILNIMRFTLLFFCFLLSGGNISQYNEILFLADFLHYNCKTFPSSSNKVTSLLKDVGNHFDAIV